MFSTLTEIASPANVTSTFWRSFQPFRSKSDDSNGRWKTLIFKLSPKCLCIGQISGFSHFISNMSDNMDQLESLCSITSNPQRFASINHIYIMSLELTIDHIECLKSILPRVEVVQIRDCRIEGDFYKHFLRYCENMKQLYVQNVDIEHFENKTNHEKIPYIVENTFQPGFECRWLLQKYQFLEHFELTPQNGGKISELKTFFEQNRSIRSFSTNSCCLYENWLALNKTTANLDYLAIDFNCWPRIYLDSICDVLNFLHQRHFYHRLHLYLPNLYGIPTKQTVALDALEKLYIKHLNHTEIAYVFNNLKELGIFEVAKEINLNIFAKNFTKLKKVYFKTASLDDVLAFIRHSTKLQEIKVQNLEPGTHLYGRILDMVSLNRERETLKNAQRVKVYVHRKMFLMSKNAMEKTKFKCIKLKRIDLNEIRKKFEFLKGHFEFVSLEQFAIGSWM